jgi:hypothetical protein
MALVFVKSSDYNEGVRQGKHTIVSGVMTASDGKGGTIYTHPRFSQLPGEVAYQAVYCKAGQKDEEAPPAGMGPLGPQAAAWQRGTRIHVESLADLLTWLKLMGVDTENVSFVQATKEETFTPPAA